jgi:iron complex transport system substrate-binding protein
MVKRKKHRNRLFVACLPLLLLILSACGNSGTANTANTVSSSANQANASNENAAQTGTIIYQSENGPVEVPANPERVVVFNPFAGHVIALGVNVVGADVWAHQNPNFQDGLKEAAEVSAESLEQIIELDPDLIIGLSVLGNIDKLNEIAPTVTYTHGKLDYLSQFLEIGKLLNKEAEAQGWIDDFKTRTARMGEAIKAKIGEDATVTIIENFDKQIYAYGNNFGRGAEILYHEMNIKMPDKIEEDVLGPGNMALSLEVLPEYVGDYLIFSKNSEDDTLFEETDTYKNIPAVKNKRVFEIDSKAYFLNDPITLDYQLAFFQRSFLGE